MPDRLHIDTVEHGLVLQRAVVHAVGQNKPMVALKACLSQVSAKLPTKNVTLTTQFSEHSPSHHIVPVCDCNIVHA